MKFNIEFEGHEVAQFQAVIAYLSGANPVVPVSTAAPVAYAPPADVDSEPKKKPGRKPKAEKPVPATHTEVAPQPAQEIADEPASIEDNEPTADDDISEPALDDDDGPAHVEHPAEPRAPIEPKPAPKPEAKQDDASTEITKGMLAGVLTELDVAGASSADIMAISKKHNGGAPKKFSDFDASGKAKCYADLCQLRDTLKAAA